MHKWLPNLVAKFWLPNLVLYQTAHIPFIPSESTLPFLSYSNFNILPWKSKDNIICEVNVWSHNVSLTFYRLTSLSFHVNQPSHSWDMTFSKFDLENPRSRSWLGQSWKSQSGCNIPLTHIPFVPCQSALPFLRYSIFKIWPWKSKVKVMGEGNVESHKVGVTSYQLTSLLFHVNQLFHSWDTAFSKFDLENPRSRSNDHDVAQLHVSTIPQNLKWYKSIQWFQIYGFR